MQLNKLNTSPSAAQPDAVDLVDRYEERAAICEYDGSLDRVSAETIAWREVASVWHRQQGERTPAHLCAGCRQPIASDPNVLLLPHGERAHAAPNNDCIARYTERWQRQAAIALASLGIPAPTEIIADER